MFRAPFVWEVQVRRELLEDEIARLRELPYSLWLDVLTRSMIKRTEGRDNRAYRIKTVAAYVQPGSEDIRVTVSLESPSLHRRLMRQSFVITPENRLAE
jgi:hypothetical protein